jgi:hypothetical protein
LLRVSLFDFSDYGKIPKEMENARLQEVGKRRRRRGR